MGVLEIKSVLAICKVSFHSGPCLLPLFDLLLMLIGGCSHLIGHLQACFPGPQSTLGNGTFDCDVRNLKQPSCHNGNSACGVKSGIMKVRVE